MAQASPAAGAAAAPPAGLRLAATFALRDLRRASGFVVFVACIALGVAAIGGIASLSRALADGLAAEGRTILGGDLEVALVHRPFAEDERATLAALGRVSEIATLRAMARRPDGAEQTLSEVKAVDDAYPLLGTADRAGGGALADALGKDAEGRFGVVVDPELADRLGLRVGDDVAIGRGSFRIADLLAHEPDRLSGGVDFGPRTIMALEALAATGLVQPGSLVHWRTRVVLPAGADDARVAAVVKAVEAAHPKAGWQVTARTEASPGLERNIARFGQFLTMIGLATLAVGGVGVANAVAAFVERKAPMIATLRALGAGGSFVFAVCLIEVMLVAAVGVAAGLAVGAAIPPLVAAALADVLPVKALLGAFPLELGVAASYGFATTLAFALWPLGRVEHVSPTMLFRDPAESRPARPRWPILAGTALAVAVVAGIAVATAVDRQIAVVFVLATLAALALLRLAAAGIMAAARRARRPRMPELRLALANVHRPGALTPTVVMSLGLGLTVTVILALVDANLRQELTGRLPATAPSFFFLDIRSDEAEDFRRFLAEHAPDATESSVPMLRGRIVSLKGIAAVDYPAPPSAQWVLRGDRGITYSAAVPDGSTVVAGEWWPADYTGPPLVSLASDTAEELGLAVGDTVVVNVLGREISARIASLRRVDWQGLGLNFLMVFSPSAFAGAPASIVSTASFPGGGDAAVERRLLAEVGRAYPTVTAVRVKDALASVVALLQDLAAAAGAAASVALAACVLVLAGALAASHQSRIYDAAVLKTLGATRLRIVAAFAAEYAIIGAATALFAALAGTLAGWAVVTGAMEIPFAAPAGLIGGTIVAAVAIAVALGLLGTWRTLAVPVAGVLRRS